MEIEKNGGNETRNSVATSPELSAAISGELSSPQQSMHPVENGGESQTTAQPGAAKSSDVAQSSAVTGTALDKPEPAKPSLPQDFAGQVAIITGGGTGLGLEIARNLACRGAHVVIASRKADVLQAAVASIESSGGKAFAIVTDVREPDQVENLVKQTVEKFGKIDILVNNAAGNFLVPAADLPLKCWSSVIGTVLNGTFFCSSAAGKQMIKQKRGCIVNIVANYADSGCPGVVHSAAAKAGVLSMTRTLAVEWGPLGVRVNAFAPGAMVTENASKLLAYNTPEAQEKIRSFIPMRRLTSAEEMAKLVVFLCSKDAEYVNGDFMVADGGHWLPRGFIDLRK